MTKCQIAQIVIPQIQNQRPWFMQVVHDNIAEKVVVWARQQLEEYQVGAEIHNEHHNPL